MTATVHETPVVDETAGEATTTTADENVLSELLVEEISIDGMCGVY